MQKYIQTDQNTKIAYTEIGEGLPLLFMHGLGSNKESFEPNIETLSRSYRCITIDLPGYGASSKNNAQVSITFFAKQVLKFTDQLQLTSLTLVGHSMGAHIALKMVHMRPTIANRLILLAPAGFESFNGLERHWFESITQPNLLKNASRDQIMQSFEVNFYAFPSEANFMLEDRLQMMLSKSALDFYCDLIYHATMGMLDEPVFQILETIHQETLVIFGEEDQLIPNQVLHPGETTLSIAQRGTDKLPSSKLVMIPFAGHFVMFEKPTAVNQAIIDFLT